MSFCTWSTTENIMRYVRDVCNDRQGQTAQRIKRFQTILSKKKKKKKSNWSQKLFTQCYDKGGLNTINIDSSCYF